MPRVYLNEGEYYENYSDECFDTPRYGGLVWQSWEVPKRLINKLYKARKREAIASHKLYKYISRHCTHPFATLEEWIDEQGHAISYVWCQCQEGASLAESCDGKWELYTPYITEDKVKKLYESLKNQEERK